VQGFKSNLVGNHILRFRRFLKCLSFFLLKFILYLSLLCFFFLCDSYIESLCHSKPHIHLFINDVVFEHVLLNNNFIHALFIRDVLKCWGCDRYLVKPLFSVRDWGCISSNKFWMNDIGFVWSICFYIGSEPIF